MTLHSNGNVLQRIFFLYQCENHVVSSAFIETDPLTAAGNFMFKMC